MPGSNERMVRRLSSWLLATATSKFRRERYSPSERVMAWSSSAIRILVFDCKRVLSSAQARRQKNEVLSATKPRACLQRDIFTAAGSSREHVLRFSKLVLGCLC